ncbi:hypothetical protein V6N12_042855 [Hibiscus sabdariffa]|uniref:Uncharacterized protein n=1 Tax=Hibiscus sabdariffa TaxID=183260 RepID=A0ABR1ZB69_9ROSI
MTSFLPSSQDPFNKTVDPPNDDEQQLHRLPTLSEALEEIKAIGKISGPTSISNLLLYSRAMISMLCLSYLGELELAGGLLRFSYRSLGNVVHHLDETPMGQFFTSDAEILDLTAVALPIVWLCELENYPQTAGCGVLRGIARPTIEVNINLGSFYIVGMPMAILMGFVVKMGFLGLWLGLLAAQAACALMMLLVLYRTDWMVQVERA